MKRIFVLMFLMVSSGMLFSQSSTYTSEPLKEYNPIVQKGTYQIILKDHRMICPELTSGIKSQINQERKQNDITYLAIDKYTSILILPFKEINDKNFTPLNEFKYED